MGKTIYLIGDRNGHGSFFGGHVYEDVEFWGLGARDSVPSGVHAKEEGIFWHLSPGSIDNSFSNPVPDGIRFDVSNLVSLMRGIFSFDSHLLDGLTPLTADILCDVMFDIIGTHLRFQNGPYVHKPTADADFQSLLGEYVTSVVRNGTYLYIGLATSPAQVVKVNISSMLEVSRWTGDINQGEQTVTSLTLCGGYLVAGLQTNPTQLVKINPATMATVSKYTGSVDEIGCWCLANDGTNIYAGTGLYSSLSPPNGYGAVLKIALSTMTEVSRYFPGTNITPVISILYNSGYVYAGYGDSTAIVRQIAANTMTLNNTWFSPTYAFFSNEHRANSLAIDGLGNLYVGVDYWAITPPALPDVPKCHVYKVNTATMTTVGTWQRAAAPDTYQPVSLILLGTHLYAATYKSGSPATIYEIDPAAMVTTNSGTLDVDETNVRAMATDGTSLFLGMYTNPGKLIKFDPSSMSKVSAFTTQPQDVWGDLILPPGPLPVSVDVPLTPAALAGLNKTGYSKLGLRLDRDINATLEGTSGFFGFYCPDKEHEKLLYFVSVTDLRYYQAQVNGMLDAIPLTDTVPPILKVVVAEGSGVISNIDVRVGYMEASTLSAYIATLNPTNNWDPNYPGFSHSNWIVSQPLYAPWSIVLSPLAPNTQYGFWLEWKFTGQSKVYWTPEAALYKPLIYYLTTAQKPAVLKKAYALGRHEL
jgi:hypothetical protein